MALDGVATPHTAGAQGFNTGTVIDSNSYGIFNEQTDGTTMSMPNRISMTQEEAMPDATPIDYALPQLPRAQYTFVEDRALNLPEPGFGTSVKRGVESTKGMLYGSAGLAGDITGIDSLRDWGYEKYLETQENLKYLPREVESLYDVDSFSKFGTWVVETLGEQVPTLGATMLGAGIGTLGVRTLGKSMIERAAAKAIQKRVTQLTATGMTESMAKATAFKELASSIGAQAGAAATSIALESGGNWTQSVDERGIENTRPFVDLAFGVVQGAMDLIGAEGQFLRKLTGKPTTIVAETQSRNWLERNFPKVVKVMGSEGGTEGLQELTSSYNQAVQNGAFDITPEDLRNAVEASIAGAIGGAVMSGPTIMTEALRGRTVNNPDDPTDTTKLLDTKQEYINKLSELSTIDGVTNAEMAVYNEELERKNTAIREIDAEYDAFAADLKEKYEKVAAEINSLKNPTNPAITAMTPEARKLALNKAEAKYAKLVSQYARVNQEREAAYKAKYEELEKLETSAANKRLAAERKAEIFNQKRKLGLQDKIENFDEVLYEALDAVDTYGGRKLEILNNSLKQIDAAINEYKNASSRYPRLYRNNPYMYDVIVRTIEQFTKQRESVVEQINNIKKAAHKVSITAATAFDPLTITAAIDEFYALDQPFVDGGTTALTEYLLTKSAAEQRAIMLKQLLDDVQKAQVLTTDPAEGALVPGATFYERLYNQEQNSEDFNAANTLLQAKDAASIEDYRASQASQPITESQKQTAAAYIYEQQKQRTQQERDATYQQVLEEEALTMLDENKRSSYPSASEIVGPPPNRRARQQVWQDLVREERQKRQQDQNVRVLNVRNAAQARAAIDRLTDLEKQLEVATAFERTQNIYNFISNTLNQLPSLIDHVVICTTVSDARIPVALHQAIVNQTYTGKRAMPKGAYYDGKIYLFAAEIKSKEQAVRTLVHEGVAHFGLRAIMSNTDFVRFMSAVYRDMSGTKLWAKWVGSTQNIYSNMDQLTQAEEFVAWLASRTKVSTLLERFPSIKNIIAYVRKLFKKLFVNNGTVTEADIMDVLSLSARNLAEGKDIAANSLLYSANTGTNLTPNYDTVHLNDTTDVRLPYGWGTYFSTLKKMSRWFNKYNQRASGVPGLGYTDLTPDLNQFIDWDGHLSKQPYILDHIKDFFDPTFMSAIVDNTDGSYTLQIFNVNVYKSSNVEELRNIIHNPEVAAEYVTGKDLYNWLSYMHNGDDKRAAQILRQKGIAGTKFVTPMLGTDHLNFCVFEGDNVSNTMPGYKNPDIRFNIEPVTTIDEMPDNYLDNMGNYLLNQQTWNNWMSDIVRTGKSIGPKGQDVKHSLFERFGPASFGTYNDWLVKDTKDNAGIKPPTWWERFVEYWFDSDKRIQVVQRYLKQAIGDYVITPTTNIYKNLTGMSNRINSQRTEVWKYKVEPILELIKNTDMPMVNAWIDEFKKRGRTVSQQDIAELKIRAVDLYLYARHAPERNKAIRSRMSVSSVSHDAFSGMTDEQAAQILERFEGVEDIQEIGDKVDELNRFGLQLIEDNMLLSKESIKKIRAAYTHYVPLKNWDEFIGNVCPEAVTRKTRSGLSIGNKEVAKKAKGRDEGDLPASPFTNSVLQVMDIIAVAEKNKVGRNLLELVQTTSHLKDLWEIDGKPETPEYKLVEDGKTGQIVYKRKSSKLEGQGFKFVSVIDPDGRKVRIAIKDEALAKALRNENLATTGSLLDMMRTIMHKLGQLYTSRNPLFIVKNPTRDMLTATLNIGSSIESAQRDDLVGADNTIRKNLVRDFLNGRMVKFLYKELRDVKLTDPKDLYLKGLYREFVNHGGHMRIFEPRDFKTTYIQLRDQLKKKSTGRKILDNLVNYVDMLADVTENATRFNVYVQLVEAFDKHTIKKAQREGWSEERLNTEIAMGHQRAANEALECTVNFSRKGAGAPVFNTLYMFSSATIAGNIRIMQNLWRSDSTRAQNIKRVNAYLGINIAACAALGFIARSIMGTDDDGENRYDKIPSYIKDSNLIVPSIFGDGGYLKIPLPYGYNLFWTIGNAIDSVFHGKLDPGHAAARIVSSAFNGFSPIGGTDGGASEFIPTLFRPVSQIFENKNTFGFNIYPDGTYGSERPDSQKFWSTCPLFYRAIAETLNSWSGGSKTESGWIDVSPESLQHLFDSYTGGVGRILTQSVDAALSPITGKPIELKDTPIANTFIGKVGYSDTLNTYSAIRRKIQAGLNEVKLAEEDESLTPAERVEIQRKNTAAVFLKNAYNNTVKQLNNLRSRQKQIEKEYNSTGTTFYRQKEQLDKQREAIMKRLIKAANSGGLQYNVD